MTTAEEMQLINHDVYLLHVWLNVTFLMERLDPLPWPDGRGGQKRIEYVHRIARTFSEEVGCRPQVFCLDQERADRIGRIRIYPHEVLSDEEIAGLIQLGKIR